MVRGLDKSLHITMNAGLESYHLTQTLRLFGCHPADVRHAIGTNPTTRGITFAAY
jgi:hypothetical protein